MGEYPKRGKNVTVQSLDPGETVTLVFTVQEALIVDNAVAIGAMTGIVPQHAAAEIIDTIKTALPADLFPPTEGEIPVEPTEPETPENPETPDQELPETPDTEETDKPETGPADETTEVQ